MNYPVTLTIICIFTLVSLYPKYNWHYAQKLSDIGIEYFLDRYSILAKKAKATSLLFHLNVTHLLRKLLFPIVCLFTFTHSGFRLSSDSILFVYFLLRMCRDNVLSWIIMLELFKCFLMLNYACFMEGSNWREWSNWSLKCVILRAVILIGLYLRLEKTFPQTFYVLFEHGSGW